MNYWVFSTYLLMTIVGVFTWYIVTYHQPILSENAEHCLSIKGVYHLRLNDPHFSDLEYCEIEKKIYYDK